jgi:CDP-paratose 2-epimerase
MGGGRENSVSMLEAISRIEKLAGRKLDWHYTEQARRGDHICYISNLCKFKNHYPNWQVTHKLDAVLEELVAKEQARQKHATAQRRAYWHNSTQRHHQLDQT